MNSKSRIIRLAPFLLTFVLFALPFSTTIVRGGADRGTIRASGYGAVFGFQSFTSNITKRTESRKMEGSGEIELVFLALVIATGAALFSDDPFRWVSAVFGSISFGLLLHLYLMPRVFSTLTSDTTLGPAFGLSILSLGAGAAISWSAVWSRRETVDSSRSAGGSTSPQTPLSPSRLSSDAGEAIGSQKGQASRSNSNSTKQADIYTALMKLDELRKRGLLNDAEFEEQKKRLLAEA